MTASNHPQIKVLDHGFVQLIDVMGEDATVAMDARTSRGHQGEPRPWEADAKLTKFMLDNGHTTPFEMIETKWLCKMPIFVARQWVRHRTASITEFSMRYADAGDLSAGEVQYYTPEIWRTQDPVNKQGSRPFTTAGIADGYTDAVDNSVKAYRRLIERGVANEMARMVLPVSVYTEWVWKIDLHNLLHFLKLRTDSHAQWEMQQYANAMLAQLCEEFPRLMEVVWPSPSA